MYFPDLILKLEVFFIRVISLTWSKMILVPCKLNRKDREFEYNFLIICRYLNLVNRKIASCYNIKVVYRLLT